MKKYILAISLTALWVPSLSTAASAISLEDASAAISQAVKTRENDGHKIRGVAINAQALDFASGPFFYDLTAGTCKDIHGRLGFNSNDNGIFLGECTRRINHFYGAPNQIMEIRGSNLRGADINGVLLDHASLLEADLRGAKMGGFTFQGRGSRVTGTIDRFTELPRNNLHWCHVSQTRIQCEFRGLD